MMRHFALGALVFLLAACGGSELEPYSPDSGQGVVVPPVPDGGAGGWADAGSTSDGGADAGTPADAGSDDAGAVDAGSIDDGGSPDAGTDAGPPPLTAADCFSGIQTAGSGPDIDYDQFGPTIGTHCYGTDHQDIENIERVVFLGDSITVGTPPTDTNDYYRNKLADLLTPVFGLAPPDLFWKMADPFSGTSVTRDSGDFSNCSEWGARTDDLVRDSTQVEDCFPVGERNKNTLVIFTVGGNDIASLTENGPDRTEQENWNAVEEFVQLLRDAIWWIKEPGRFPNGVSVIFSNLYEFTDGTGDIESCPAAGMAGFTSWQDPDLLADLVIWANEQYMSIAVETGTDMIFALEAFCGHGFRAGDASARCFRGLDAETWFDFTCIHPNPTGHQALADMFNAIVDE